MLLETVGITPDCQVADEDAHQDAHEVADVHGHHSQHAIPGLASDIPLQRVKKGENKGRDRTGDSRHQR